MNTAHYPSLELCKKLTDIGFPETEKRIIYYPDINNEIKTEILPKEMVQIGDVCPSVMEMIDVLSEERKMLCLEYFTQQSDGNLPEWCANWILRDAEYWTISFTKD